VEAGARELDCSVRLFSTYPTPVASFQPIIGVQLPLWPIFVECSTTHNTFLRINECSCINVHLTTDKCQYYLPLWLQYRSAIWACG